MGPDEKKRIKEELEKMSRYTQTNLIDTMTSEEQLDEFLDGLEKNPKLGRADGEMSPADTVNMQIRDKIRGMMMKDMEGAAALGESFRNIQFEVNKKIADYNQKASEKKKKLESAQVTEQRRTAQERLKDIAKARSSVRNLRHGFDRDFNYNEATEKSEIKGNSSNTIFTKGIAEMGFGDQTHRRHLFAVPDYPDKHRFQSEIEASQDITITKEKPHLQLCGHKYVPKNPNGKVVLCLTGSHNPGANYIEQMADSYLKEGTTVINFDYRGFGNSAELDKNGDPKETFPSEKSMYEDAHLMYKYITNDMEINGNRGLDPANVIIHGYSLGGPIAAKLAADIAQDNQVLDGEYRKTLGMPLQERQRLGGLVLHSPMPSSSYSAKVNTMQNSGNKFKAWIGSIMAKFSMGSMDLSSNMKRLNKFDPNLPVHYTGGKVTGITNHNGNFTIHGDWLSPHVTRVHENPDIQFKNQSHKFFDDIGHADKLPLNDPCLAELQKGGRNAKLKVISEQINRLENNNHILADQNTHQEDLDFTRAFPMS